jgi:hypothetical protein
MGRPKTTTPEMRYEKQKVWKSNNKDKVLEYSRSWHEKHREEERQKARSRLKSLRLFVIETYGGKCNCCGESHIEFLQIDHVNGTNKDKKRGDELLLEVRKSGYSSEYQVLCANCNFAKRNTNICPVHEREFPILS